VVLRLIALSLSFLIPLQEMTKPNLSLTFPWLVISFKGFSKAEKSFSLLGYAPIGSANK
jgi:hypothetical protein